MGRLLNSESTVRKLWNPIIVRNLFCEMSVVTTATRCNTPKDIRDCYRHENILEGSVLLPRIALWEIYTEMKNINDIITFSLEEQQK
jgi:hypothetical protein